MPRQMLYKSCLRGYTPYAGGLRSSLTEWIIQWMAHKRKLANIFIVFRAMKKSYLILHIIYAYNVHISRLRSEDATPVKRLDSDHVLDFGRKMRLWSYAQLLLEDVIPNVCSAPVIWLTPVEIRDSGRKTQLQSCAQLQSKDATLVVCPTPVRKHDSGWTSWLRLNIMTPVVDHIVILPTRLWKN
jgi:hypothetical protein